MDNVFVFLVTLCVAGINQISNFARFEKNFYQTSGTALQKQLALTKIQSLCDQEAELAAGLIAEFIAGNLDLDGCKQASKQQNLRVHQKIIQLCAFVGVQTIQDSPGTLDALRQHLLAQQNLPIYLTGIFQSQIKPLLNFNELIDNFAQTPQDDTAQYFQAALSCLVFTQPQTIFAANSDSLKNIVTDLANQIKGLLQKTTLN